MTQYVYVIMNKKMEYLHTPDGRWWATDFINAKIYANKYLALRANKTIKETVYKVEIKPTILKK